MPEVDLLIYVTAVSTNCGSSTLAYASACYLDQKDRPIVGNVNFCLANSAYSEWAESDIEKVVLHELIHVLGFSSFLYSFFRDESGLPRTPRCPGASGCTVNDIPSFPPFNELTYTYAVSASTVITQAGLEYIVTPAVTAVARAYFACPALPGAPLEDHGSSGTAGSHWKERMLFTELMTGEIDNNFSPVLSEFTLALLADSGWYRVNLSAADAAPPMLWGRGRGCEHFDSACAAAPFCAANYAQGCTFDRAAVGVCIKPSTFMDGCRTVYPYASEYCLSLSTAVSVCGDKPCYGSHVGPDSACFESTLLASGYIGKVPVRGGGGISASSE